jgi:hypothetical protein
MEKFERTPGRWSRRKILFISLAIGAVVVFALVVAASAGGGSGGLY